MLRYKLRQAIELNGNIKPYTWLNKVCGFTPRKASNYSLNKQKNISLKDLSILCENLNFTPNDLLYWEQTPGTTLPANHPCITQLSLPPALSNIEKIIKNIHASEVEESINFLKSKMKK